MAKQGICWSFLDLLEKFNNICHEQFCELVVSLWSVKSLFYELLFFIAIFGEGIDINKQLY